MNVNVMKIIGNWDLGYVLDWHVESSEFLGYNQFGQAEFETKRTEIGEAIFQLKYRNDTSKIEILAYTMAQNLKTKFLAASFIVPMPPSKRRGTQPAIELARKVAEKMELPFFENILLKKGSSLDMSW